MINRHFHIDTRPLSLNTIVKSVLQIYTNACSQFPSMTSYEICGRQKGDMNATNWTRHVNSCRSKIPTSKRNLSKAKNRNNLVGDFFIVNQI
ncbi:Uncharacterized protein FWK35_00025624 [Aphis craccivora]|uniref:Uncharacterized protein n=1 Tax=Aphis craccivora TaxID=307492 RepID=A0A6G0VLJ8_APHCR|nr:Uncharacterized protein FWK35_00025624 [Aphis craccivora]